MDTKINMFIEPIIDKKSKYDLFSWIKMRKLCKKLKKVSPDFNMLMQIYYFLNLLSDLYMHSSNNESLHLFAATLPTQNYNGGAFIYEDKYFSMKFLLGAADRSIKIELETFNRNKKNKSIISFIEGESVINNKYDEEKFRFIISCVMDGVTELIQYYYNNKRF